MTSRLLVGALVAGLALTACGSGGSGGGSGAAPAREVGGSDRPLVLQVRAEPEEAAVYRSLVSAYEEASGRDVELVAVGRQEHLTRLSTGFASGSAPDVFLINYREYAPFVQRGAVEPVGPLLEREGVDLGDYYDEPLRAFSYGGRLQCMPQNISSLVVYWNRALFERAGVAPPARGWTFEDFAATARALTGGEVKGVGIDPTVTRLAPFVWSAGGDVVDDDDAPTRTTLHEPAARGALQAVLDLLRSGVAPDAEAVAAQGLEEQFMNGRLAMFLSSRVEVPALREQRGLDFDVADLPVLGEPASVLHSDAYCVSRTASDPEAAADLIAYATGQQGQTLTALGGRTVPSLRSVATSPAFLNPARAPASSQVFLDAVPELRHTPVTPAWPEVEDVIGVQLERAFADGVPLDEVLAEVRAQADPLLRAR